MYQTKLFYNSNMVLYKKLILKNKQFSPNDKNSKFNKLMRHPNQLKKNEYTYQSNFGVKGEVYKSIFVSNDFDRRSLWLSVSGRRLLNLDIQSENNNTFS